MFVMLAVELGRRYFPNYSQVLDKILEDLPDGPNALQQQKRHPQRATGQEDTLLRGKGGRAQGIQQKIRPITACFRSCCQTQAMLNSLMLLNSRIT